MSKFAWIESGVIRDACDGPPLDRYHPSVATYYSTEVPDEAAGGDTWDGYTLSKSEKTLPHVDTPAIPAVVPDIKVSPVEFKLLFTPSERITIKSMALEDPVLADSLEILNDLRLTEVNLGLQSNRDYLAYLVSKGALEEHRVSEILTGVLK